MYFQNTSCLTVIRFKMTVKSPVNSQIMAGCILVLILFAGWSGEDERNTSDISVSGRSLKLLPSFEGGLPVMVLLTMDFLDIKDIDSMNRRLWVKSVVRMEWKDPRVPFYIINDLNIQPTEKWDFNTMEEIWKPNIFCFQDPTGETDGISKFLRIQPDGYIYWTINLKWTLACDMDFTNFPHDTQICPIYFQAYGRYSTEVDVQWSQQVENELGKNANVHSFSDPEFSLEYVTFENTLKAGVEGYYTIPKVYIKFKRNIGLYMRKLYLPYILIILVTSLTFWFDHEIIVLRLSLLLSVLFVMIASSLEIGKYTPRTSYMKPVDLWIGTSFSFVISAILVCVLVCQAAKNSERGKNNRAHIDSEVRSMGEEADTNEKSETDAETKLSAAKRVACRLFGTQKWEIQLDMIFRFLYPALFAIFNIIYWSYILAE